MIAPVFVDADILVYARDASETVKQPRAADWIARLWSERAGRTSMPVLSEYYVTVTRKMKPAMSASAACNDVRSYLVWKPHPANEVLLQCTREIEQRYRLNWPDSMVVAAVRLLDCALLLTEVLPDGAAFGSVTVRSPFTLSVEASRGSYIAASTIHRHPPRGRPPGVSKGQNGIRSTSVEAAAPPQP